MGEGRQDLMRPVSVHGTLPKITGSVKLVISDAANEQKAKIFDTESYICNAVCQRFGM